MRARLALLAFAVPAFAVAATAVAAPRTIAVDGLAAIRDGDVDAARAAALSDGLRQALLSGASIAAETVVDEGQLVSDELRVTAAGRLASHRVVEETRSGDVLRLRIEAVVADRDDAAAACPATPVAIGDVALDVDPGIDPALAPEPGRVVDGVRAAIARTGAAPGEVGAWLPPRGARSSAAYDALLAPAGALVRAGLVMQARVTLRRVGGTYFPLPMTRPSAVEALVEVALIDAATGVRIGSAARAAIARRSTFARAASLVAGVQLAPAEVALQPLLDAAASDLLASTACRSTGAAVVERRGDALRLDGGARQGLREGDIVRIGDGGAGWRDDDWSVAVVTDVEARGSTARLLDPKRRGESAAVATALR